VICRSVKMLRKTSKSQMPPTAPANANHDRRERLFAGGMRGEQDQCGAYGPPEPPSNGSNRCGREGDFREEDDRAAPTRTKCSVSLRVAPSAARNLAPMH
jgi:hypothetical protein